MTNSRAIPRLPRLSYLLILIAATCLSGSEKAAEPTEPAGSAESTAAEGTASLPEPKSEGPYLEGDLMVPEGFYFKLEDGSAINLRIIDNFYHVFFLDADGLVAASPFAAGNIRIINATTGPKRFYLQPLADPQPGFKANRLKRPPHNDQLVLTLSKDADYKDIVSHVFRYTRAAALSPEWELPAE